MATPKGGNEFDPGLVMRVAGALRYATTGKIPDWFGPNAPLPPAAPDSVKGRPWDFPVGINLQYQPRLDQGTNDLTAATLRRIADPVQGGLDLLRLAIETRKDQMEAQKWCIKGRDGKDGGQKARDIEASLRRPDLVHTFRQWARPLWDDLLVIDAPSIYFRPVPTALFAGGFMPEVVDGATIKILIDPNGRTPLPPQAAYQQVMKGLPAVDYTLNELLYSPRNLRSYRFYGMSPVEQVIGIANIGLKRQLHLLNYYTEGTVPDAVLTPPESWNPDQIKQAQKWLDMLSDSSVKRKIRILPGGNFTQTRDPKLKDELDDWLARIICWCFSVAPGALVKDMTKATAGTNAQTAHEEGLEPFKLWWKDVMDQVVAVCYAAPDLEFAYQEEEVADANIKMTIWTGYKAAGIVTADEVRDKALGFEPMTPEQKDEEKPPPPPLAATDPAPGPSPGKGPGTAQGAESGGSATPLPPAQKSAHIHGLQKKKVVLIDRNRAAVTKCVNAVDKLFKARFLAQKTALVAAIKDQATKLAKVSEDKLRALLDTLDVGDLDELRKAIAARLKAIAEDGVIEGMAQVTNDPLDAMLAQANENAIAFAEARAAELVGMRWNADANAYIVNPNPEWAIDQTTRDNIQALTTKAMKEGWSNDQLAEAVQDDHSFSSNRSDMIARTETAFADAQGSMASYAASGLVEATEWIVGDGDCDECQANADAGAVPLGEAFPSGDEMAPSHPNCFLQGTLISAAGVTAQTKRWFEGKIVRVLIEGEIPFSVTPNHPILTRRGWIAAGELQEGEDVFRVSDPSGFVRFLNPYDHHMQTRIEEVGNSLLMTGRMATISVPSSPKDFHSDGTPGQQVYIVRANCGLDGAREPLRADGSAKPYLVVTDANLEGFARSSTSALGLIAMNAPLGSDMGRECPGKSGLSASTGSLDVVRVSSGSNVPTIEPNHLPDGQVVAPIAGSDVGRGLPGIVSLDDGRNFAVRETPLDRLSISNSTDADAAGLEKTTHCIDGNAPCESDIDHALAQFISPAKVVRVSDDYFSGHVYNLETEGGWYVAGSILTHNCRCDNLPVIKQSDDGDE